MIILKIIFAPIYLVVLSLLVLILRPWLRKKMPGEVLILITHLLDGDIIECIPRFYFSLSSDDNSRRFSVDYSSQASRPGTIRVNWLQWIKYHPYKQFVYIILVAAMITGALLLHWSLWIASGILIYFNILYWQTIQERFLFGCINPGMIISVDPMFVAVSTDLGKWGGYYPVIKIIKANLKSVLKNADTVGTLVPTVATYGHSADDVPHWKDFYPVPVEYANGDMKIIIKSLDSLEQPEIAELERWLKQVPEPYECGLYWIKAEDS